MATTNNDQSANLGFESHPWAADTLRNIMDAAEDKYVVLGLIFLKYISDAFETEHNANYARVQSFRHHLALSKIAGLVHVHDSISSNQSGKGEFRRARSDGSCSDCIAV